jgi:ABC-type polysaccharide/polyol phosphate transport system ATPase subunit
MNLNFVFETSD